MCADGDLGKAGHRTYTRLLGLPKYPLDWSGMHQSLQKIHRLKSQPVVFWERLPQIFTSMQVFIGNMAIAARKHHYGSLVKTLLLQRDYGP